MTHPRSLSQKKYLQKVLLQTSKKRHCLHVGLRHVLNQEIVASHGLATPQVAKKHQETTVRFELLKRKGADLFWEFFSFFFGHFFFGLWALCLLSFQLTWCGWVVFLWWCFCGGGGVVILWWCGWVVLLWWCGSAFMFLWWCFCGGVVVLWWCFCGGVFVVVFLWWCFLWWCGSAFMFLWWCGGVFVLV